MAEKGPSHRIVEDFSLYLAYEILTNELVPERAAAAAMEDVFGRTGNVLLAYALAHVYIRQGGVATEKSRNILINAISAAFENDIIFPIFKEIKDKSLLAPYIEKNRPFVYRGRAGRDISLHYRVGDGDFVELAMSYMAFGLYFCHVPHFYGEEIEYFFCENRERGSIKTATATISNKSSHMLENEGDLYYTINKALIYEQMFKYERVEEIVSAQLEKKANIRAKIL